MDDQYLKVAVARLKTLDGKKYYFQRRNNKTHLFPEGLSFFGGHIEPGETAEDTVHRELTEETSIDLGETALEKTVALTVLPPAAHDDQPVEVHVFDSKVDSFDVKEGASVELLTKEEALNHPDLVPTTRHILEQEFGENNGAINN
jgi:8-oxo-dGTP pyrophosphatase MutT (NUDIX family)